MPSVRFPAYTSRESRPTRPAGLGLFFCFAAVTCYAIVLATVGSPAFSAYFDSGGKPVDLVVSDMSPNLSGVEPADQARSVHLGELALDFAISHLSDGGDLAIKVFQGSGLAELQRSLAAVFDKVYVRKPKSSRDRSRETFLVGKGFVRKSA